MSAFRPYLFLFLFLSTLGYQAGAQAGFQLKLDKPKEYEERVLRGEKTPDKKIRIPQRILQNTITRYNYFFNASNKLNEVITKAKQAFQDDYSKLLPFYNYTLEKTAEDGVQLDSIIWKSNSGIVLHDLRSDWTDDLYLLWGAAYYFQQKFDSARILFQFINQSYAPREKDGYARTIGSGRDGNSALSISTPEKKGFARKMLSGPPPRRNDAFLWQIRNYIAQEKFAEAASLLEALRRDPVFPDRLKEDLHEVQSWWFYQQQNWDSAAHHLSQALGQATSQNERARWEYLLGQLYERTGKWSEAEKFYSRCIPRTTNPILEIYARLGSIRTNRDGGKDEIADNIRELRQMAKRDKYLDYRDIIYFMAAQMQSQTGDWNATKDLLMNSVQVPSNNSSQRNQAFEQLARICLQQKEYRQAYNYYDSIRLDDPKLPNPDSIRQIKDVLGVIATQLEVIERQDSILRIVAMPEDDRKDFIRKLVKEIRRTQGLKDEPVRNNGMGGAVGGGAVFAGSGDQKGEWYFYNASSRSRGLAEFQARWGNRPNTDNWRRSSATGGAMQTVGGSPTTPGNNGTTPSGAIDFESLYATLPLDPTQQKILHDSLQLAWFTLGKTYIQRMEDCAKGTAALETVAVNYPAFQPMDEALFLLYYCYQRNGDSIKARTIRTRLEKDFSNSEKTNLIVTGKDPVLEKMAQATAVYQSVYDRFVSGQYNEALQRKQVADSLFGRNFWTPQLTYVEAVAHIQQRADSLAMDRLRYIIQNFPSSPLAPRAETLLRVLSKRDSIEQALRKTDNPNDSSRIVTDTVTAKKTKNPFSFRPKLPQSVVLVLEDLDAAYTTEAKNSVFRYNRNNYFDRNYQLELIPLNDKQTLLLINPFLDANQAANYLTAMRKVAATEILSWLSASRYRFGIIDAENLQQVRAQKSYNDYETFLRNEFPSLFLP